MANSNDGGMAAVMEQATEQVAADNVPLPSIMEELGAGEGEGEVAPLAASDVASEGEAPAVTDIANPQPLAATEAQTQKAIGERLANPPATTSPLIQGRTSPIKLAREYSKFRPEDAKVLDKVGNIAYAHFAPLLEQKYQWEAKEAALQKELAEAKGKTTQEWVDNPNAYQLSEAYPKLVERQNLASAIADHWEQQMIAIDQGKDWQDLVQDKDGNLVLGEVRKDGAVQKYKIQRALLAAETERGRAGAEMGQLREGFASSHKAMAAKVTANMDAFILNQLAPELRPVKGDIDQFMASVPPDFQRSFPTSEAAKMFGIIIAQAKALASLKSGSAVAATNQREQALALPRGSTNGSAASKASSNDPIVLDDVFDMV